MAGRSIRARLGVAVALALLAATTAFAATQGSGQTRSIFETEDAAAWLPSNQQGWVHRLDGTISGGSSARGAHVAVAYPGDDIEAVQFGTDAFVLNQSRGTMSLVSAATETVTDAGLLFSSEEVADARMQVWSNGEVTWVYSGRTGEAVWLNTDEMRPVGERLPLASEPAGAVVDAEGAAWVYDTRTGALQQITLESVIGNAIGSQTEQVFAPGNQVQLVGAGTWIAAVDQDDPAVAYVGEDRIERCPLDLDPGAVLAPTSVSLGNRIVVVGTDGRAVVAGPGDCDHDRHRVGDAGDVFGRPVVVAGVAFVPNYSTASVHVFDLDDESGSVRVTDPLGQPGETFDLVEDSGVVFFNYVSSATAGIVRPDGDVVATNKYDFGDDGESTPSTGEQPETEADDAPPPDEEPEPTPEPDPNPEPDEEPEAEPAELAAECSSNPASSAHPGDLISFGVRVTPVDRQVEAVTWDFGNGEQANGGTQVSYAYPRAGNFTWWADVRLADGTEIQCEPRFLSIPEENVPVPLDAAFSVDTSSPTVGQTVAFTDGSSPASEITSRTWTFEPIDDPGNGFTLADPPGSPVTTSFDQAGSWRVTLRVARGGETASTHRTIEVRQPPPPEEDLEIRVLAPAQAAMATAGSPNPISAQIETISGSWTSARWEFVPPSAPGTTPSPAALGSAATTTFSLDHAGTWTLRATVTATDGSTASAQATILVVQQPGLAFVNFPANAEVGESVTFTASTAPGVSIASWSWTFGDGGTAGTATTASHTYGSAGSYDVTVQVVVDGVPFAISQSIDISASLITVPDLTGLTQANAQTTLSNAGLVAAGPVLVCSTTVAADLVISTQPAAGTRVVPGTSVTLTVSDGSAVNVPGQVGQTQAAAEAALLATGVVASVVPNQVISTNPADDGIVLAQDTSGPTCSTGLTVTIDVGVFQAGSATISCGGPVQVGAQVSCTVNNGMAAPAQISWGDGVVDALTTHTYGATGTYNVVYSDPFGDTAGTTIDVIFTFDAVISCAAGDSSGNPMDLGSGRCTVSGLPGAVGDYTYSWTATPLVAGFESRVVKTSSATFGPVGCCSWGWSGPGDVSVSVTVTHTASGTTDSDTRVRWWTGCG